MDLSEDELVAAIRKVLSGESPGVVIGVGDDAAVLEPRGGETVVTTDMLVEGVHFDTTATSAKDLGYKAIVVNLSDIAAMGASPRAAVVSLGLPPTVDASWVVELYGGMRDASAEYALSVVGGDLSRATEVTLAVAAIGEVARGGAVTRSGARPGDRIVVTGDLGAAAGGLRLARALPSNIGEALSSDWARELLRLHLRPVARVGEGQTLAQAGATAMMDLSDGLARDLWRLCEASGVGARVSMPDIPVADALQRAAGVSGIEPFALALSGGEDYELLATMERSAVEGAAAELRDRFGVRLTDIGSIIEEGFLAVDAEGREFPLEAKGWDHFAAG